MHDEFLEDSLEVREQVLAAGALGVLEQSFQVVVLLHMGAAQVAARDVGFVVLVISRCHLCFRN